MRTSDAGIELIKQFEGLRLRAYPDPATGGDPWTIGYGSTTDVEPGDVVTPEGAERRLREDLQEAEDAVAALVTVPLNDNQHAALVSFVFNLGYGNFNSSTLLRKINACNYSGAKQEFKRWVYGNSRVMAGLERRRKAEAELFGTPGDWYASVERGGAT